MVAACLALGVAVVLLAVAAAWTAARPAPAARVARVVARALPGRSAAARKARVAAHVLAARAAVVADRFAETADHLDAALAEGAPSWPPSLLELGAIATVGAVATGDPARAHRQLDRLAAVAAAGRPAPVVDATIARHRAQAYRHAGAFADARAELDRADAVLSRGASALDRAMVALHRSEVALDDGRLDEADAHARATQALLHTDRRPVNVGAFADAAMAGGVMARAAAARRDVVAAERHAAEMAALLERFAPGYCVASLDVVRAVVGLAGGDAVAALGLASAARERFEAMGVTDAADAAVVAARCRRAVGDEAGARHDLDAAIERFERGGRPHLAAAARRERDIGGDVPAPPPAS